MKSTFSVIVLSKQSNDIVRYGLVVGAPADLVLFERRSKGGIVK